MCTPLPRLRTPVLQSPFKRTEGITQKTPTQQPPRQQPNLQPGQQPQLQPEQPRQQLHINGHVHYNCKWADGSPSSWEPTEKLIEEFHIRYTQQGKHRKRKQGYRYLQQIQEH